MKRLALVLPLALVTACGGGGTDHVASGLSKAAYISQAEAICKKANSDAKAQTFPTTSAALPAYIGSVLGIAETAEKALAALEPPAADKAELQSKVFDPLEARFVDGKAYLVKVKAAVAKNDQTELGKLFANPPTGSKADTEWMTSYGFKECLNSAKLGG